MPRKAQSWNRKVASCVVIASKNAEQNMKHMDTHSRADTLVLVVIAATVALVHVLTNHHYGFHRDELQVLSDALHLDWGFVPYPPLTPFLERIGLALFGVSLVGLRLFSVLAKSFVVFVSGLVGSDAGGRRMAQ